MKKSTRSPVQFFILILFAVVVSCDNDDDDELTTAELLIGTWTTSDVVIHASVGTQSLVDYLVNVEGLSPDAAAIRLGILESMLEPEVTGSLTLNQNNTYSSSFGAGSDNGTWNLSTDENTLTLYEGSNVIPISINTISANTLSTTISNVFQFDADGVPGTPDETVAVEADLTLTK